MQDLGLGNLRELLTDSRVVGQHRRENVGMVLVLDASFERLTDWQKIWLQNVSVYRGAFDAEATMAMLPQADESCPLPVERGELEQELRKLVKRSLLEEKLNGKRQFAFQPVVLEYVRYKAGEQTEAHQQAIAYYRSIAKEDSWQSIDDVKEYLEIFYHYYQLRDYGSAFDTVRTCDDFLTLRGYYAVRVELYGQLVAAWQQTDARENWNYQASLISLGNAYYSLGQYQRAIEYFQQSLAIFKEIGDRNGEARSLGNLGNAYKSLGQYQRAIEFYQQSLEIFRDIGDRQGEANSLNSLGSAYNSLGQYQRAIEFYQQSLEIKRDIGDRQGEASSLIGLGSAYNSLGQYQRAIEFYQQSLEIIREIGDRQGEANSLNNLGIAYGSLGQYPQAIEYFQQSLAIFKEIGDRQGEASSLNNLGSAYKSLGQYQRAIDFHQQSLEIAREIGDRQGEASSLGNLGNAYYSLGQYQQAIEFYQQSLEIAREIGDRNGEARSLGNLGLALENVNREADAIGAYRNARELYRAMELDAKVQDCDQAIERLSPSELVSSRQSGWQWLNRLWCWIKRLWQWLCTWLRR